MDAVQAVKPRVSFAAFQAARRQPTIAQLIKRYVEEMSLTARPVGLSGRYTFKNLMNSALGPIVAAALTDQDVIAHCRVRKTVGVKPCTVEKDISCLVVVLKYAKAAWPDCKDIKPDVVKDVKPFLTKHLLIAKSEFRTRLPTPEEIERLIEYFRRPNPWNRRRIDMATITLWQVWSARRIGETCRLLWEDWNREKHTILVRKMKDPRSRNKNKLVAVPYEAQSILIWLWEIRDSNEPRIFPYRTESCIAAYVAAKQALGIDGLHLHDSRAECSTVLIEDCGYSITQTRLVTGHETNAMLERRYARLNAERFLGGPVVARPGFELFATA